MIQQIDKWLRDQKRQYAFGLSIFFALASDAFKKNYGEYFRSGENEEVKPDDPRFPMLINKVTAIYNIVKSDPDKYAEALAKLVAPIVKTRDDVKKIIALKEETEILKAQIEDFEESDEEQTAEIEDLQDELESKNSEIDELKEQLKAKGLKVMDAEDLPKTIKEKYDSIKVITPLIAAIHAELKDTTITDEQRQEKALELCNLFDERLSLWDDIDNYLNDYNSVLTEEKKDRYEYSQDPVLRGMQMAKRIKRLNENITRTKESIDKFIEKKKPEMEKKARERLAEYEDELKYLLEQTGEKK